MAELLFRVEDFLGRVQHDGSSVRANLAEVLMAQSYQDLSGQIIRTVIKLVAELERTLANFSELAGEGGVAGGRWRCGARVEWERIRTRRARCDHRGRGGAGGRG